MSLSNADAFLHVVMTSLAYGRRELLHLDEITMTVSGAELIAALDVAWLAAARIQAERGLNRSQPSTDPDEHDA